ncbi:hypothetical protein CV093_04310 [Oceanobacillus sp. 143]|nr:hypothetical protein CV093_04310 [Oceanobacillus sp. 143]
MKKISIGLLCALLLLTSCAPNSQSDEEELLSKGDQETKTSIVPSYRLGDDNYRIIIPYEPSEARALSSTRLSIDWILTKWKKDCDAIPRKYSTQRNYISKKGNI